MSGLASLRASATQTIGTLSALTSAAAGASSAIAKLPAIDPRLEKLLSFEGAVGSPRTIKKDGKDVDLDLSAFEYSAALDIVKSYIEDFTKNEALSFAELQRRGIDPALREQERQKDIAYFAKAFGDKFGSLDEIAKKLYEYQKRATTQDGGGFTPASEARLTKAVETSVEKSTGPVSVRLGGYLLNLQESIRKLEAEREALKRERQAATTATKTATRTPLPAPAPPTATVPLTLIFKAGGLP